MGPKRGPRGGKKVARAKQLAEAFARGDYVPIHNQAPSSDTGIARSLEAFERVVSENRASSSTENRASSSRGEHPEDVHKPKGAASRFSEPSAYPVTRPVAKALSVRPPPPPKVASTDLEGSPSEGPVPPKETPKVPVVSKVLLPPPPKASGIAVGSSSVVSKGSQVPKTPPKAVPGPNIPPKKEGLKRSLAEKTEEFRPSKPKGEFLVKAPASVSVREFRLSLDCHGVLNISEAGDIPGESSLHPNNAVKLRQFLAEVSDRGVVVGITSYIGESGRHSASRKANLIESVRAFNIAQPPGQKLGLRIVGDKDKSVFLAAAGVDLHIDDRADTVQKCQNGGLGVIHITRYRSRFTSFPNLRSALDHVLAQSLSIRVRDQPFHRTWLVPGA